MPAMQLNNIALNAFINYVYTTPDRFENGTKIDKTRLRLHGNGADLFENVTFTVATRPRRGRTKTEGYPALCKHKHRYFLVPLVN